MSPAQPSSGLPSFTAGTQEAGRAGTNPPASQQKGVGAGVHYRGISVWAMGDFPAETPVVGIFPASPRLTFPPAAPAQGLQAPLSCCPARGGAAGCQGPVAPGAVGSSQGCFCLHCKKKGKIRSSSKAGSEQGCIPTLLSVHLGHRQGLFSLIGTTVQLGDSSDEACPSSGLGNSRSSHSATPGEIRALV